MSTEKNAFICVLGLSDDPSRYAYKAIERLQSSGYNHLIGVHPDAKPVLGVEVVESLEAIQEPLHTLTLYLNPTRLDAIFESIIKAKPKRLIFNPGTEHPTLMRVAKQKGIQVIEACTLVLLASKQF